MCGLHKVPLDALVPLPLKDRGRSFPRCNRLLEPELFRCRGELDRRSELRVPVAALEFAYPFDRPHRAVRIAFTDRSRPDASTRDGCADAADHARRFRKVLTQR